MEQRLARALAARICAMDSDRELNANIVSYGFELIISMRDWVAVSPYTGVHTFIHITLEMEEYQMKRRFLTVALALILCLSLSVSAFASSASKTGWAEGSGKKIKVTANLNVNIYGASATTSSATDFVGYTIFTSVTYKYTLNGSTVTSYGEGTTAAGAGITEGGRGVSATSWHSVSGPATHGSWSCGLSASAS